MFELFNVPNTSFMPKPVLSLYSNGQTNGLVVHSGYKNTQVVPIFEGYPLEHAVRRLPIGGHHISLYLMKLLNDRGYEFNHFHNLENLRFMKEKCCYYSADYEKELATYRKDMEQSYTLPDGMVVKINTEALVYLKLMIVLKDLSILKIFRLILKFKTDYKQIYLILILHGNVLLNHAVILNRRFIDF